MPHSSLVDYFQEFWRLDSETAYVHRRGYRTVRWSYGQIARTAAQFSEELIRRKINRGDHVVLWGENTGEWIAVFWGCIHRRVVIVPIDKIATPDFVSRVCQEVDAKLIVHSRCLSPKDTKRPALILELITVGEDTLNASKTTDIDLGRDDILEILFTSGTTGEPKGVVLTHGNILANLEPLEREINKYRRYERFVHPLRFLNLLPLSHVFGQFLSIFLPPLIGGTVIFQDTLNPAEVIKTIRLDGVSVLAAVPRMFESLRGKIERDMEAAGRLDHFKATLQSAQNQKFWKRWWRFRGIHRQFGWKFWAMVSGGSALDSEDEIFWERLGFLVIQGYGLTETASMISLNHPFRLSRGSIGKVLPGREIKLAHDGEILVRGESIAGSYWQGKRMLPVVGADGWFRTGDLGSMDEKGNLFFKGRKKNLIVTAAGMNVYPEDLEAALRQQPGVRDCVVVGLARGGNEEPCAVLLFSTLTADPKKVVEAANQSLAEYQRMRRWFVWPTEDFPRSATQKPRLGLIREAAEAYFRDQSLSVPSVLSVPSTPLGEMISRITGREIPKLDSSESLEQDLGLSSLDRVELISALEDRFQTEISENQFSAATTVGDVEQMIRQPGAARSRYPYPRWAQRWPAQLFRVTIYYLLVWPATLLLGYPAVRGKENLRGVRGPLLFAINHVTPIDIGFVLAALPARFRHRLAVAMIGERLQKMRYPPPEVKWLARQWQKIGFALVTAIFNVFALPKMTGFRESFQYAGESADRGYSVAVFPEGQLTRDGKLGEFRKGIGLLASRLNVPVIPIRIDGLFKLREAGKKFALPGTIRILIGQPVRYEPTGDPEQIALDVRTRMTNL